MDCHAVTHQGNVIRCLPPLTLIPCTNETTLLSCVWRQCLQRAFQCQEDLKEFWKKQNCRLPVDLFAIDILMKIIDIFTIQNTRALYTWVYELESVCNTVAFMVCNGASTYLPAELYAALHSATCKFSTDIMSFAKVYKWHHVASGYQRGPGTMQDRYPQLFCGRGNSRMLWWPLWLKVSKCIRIQKYVLKHQAVRWMVQSIHWSLAPRIGNSSKLKGL